MSGNLWSRELRARNKDDPQAMDRIDVAAALAGNSAALAQSPRAGSPFIPAPDAAWFDGHVADFALHALDHGGRPGAAPLAPVRDGGASLTQRMRQGVQLNHKTRTLWERVMTDADHARKAGREAMWVELLTDDMRLRNAQDVMALGREASGLRLTVLNDVAGLARTISVSTAWLAEHFALAHRYDKLKNALLRVVSEGIPVAGTAALLALTQPARGALEGTRGVMGPGGTVERGVRGAVEVERSVAGSAQAAGRALAASETVGLSGALSIFSAGLQWHLHGVNEAKLDELRDRLVRFPGLKDEQKQAINDATSMIELGSWANRSGMVGGLLEVAGLASADMRKAKFAQGAFASKAMSGVAAGAFAFAGAMAFVGGFMDAAQNYRKFQEKRQKGRNGMALAFLGDSVAHFLGGGFLGAAGIEIGYHWTWNASSLKASPSAASRTPGAATLATASGTAGRVAA